MPEETSQINLSRALKLKNRVVHRLSQFDTLIITYNSVAEDRLEALPLTGQVTTETNAAMTHTRCVREERPRLCYNSGGSKTTRIPFDAMAHQ